MHFYILCVQKLINISSYKYMYEYGNYSVAAFKHMILVFGFIFAQKVSYKTNYEKLVVY